MIHIYLVCRLLPKILFISIIFLVSTLALNAETKKDTLLAVAWRDTFRMKKAQIVSLSSEDHLYFRSKPFGFVKYIPKDIYLMGKSAVSKKNLPKLGAILAGSALLVAVDQPITDAAKQFGRYLNIDPARKSKTLIEFNIGNFHVNALEIPDNVNSTIYYLGEGWASMLIAGGLYGYGLAANDYRAIRTTSQITESIFALGLTTQFLKRITGRQSPFRAMDYPGGVPGGDWHPFPSPARYQKSVSNYDAFPSGHFATAMATITILSGNYPDNKFIRPVGYSLMGLLGFAMLNNGVHWMSDYPLAIAIGYTCGKIIVARGHQVLPKHRQSSSGATSSFLPAFMGNGTLGFSYRATF